MSTEVIHRCDNCNKEVWSQSSCAVITVYAHQGVGADIKKWEENDRYPYWKHREIYSHLLCEKCIGEAVTVNHGDDHCFRLSHYSKKFMKKWGFIRSGKAKETP